MNPAVAQQQHCRVFFTKNVTNTPSSSEHELHADVTVHNRPGSGPIVDWDVKSIYEMTGITRPHVVRPDGQADEREEWSWARATTGQETRGCPQRLEAPGIAGEPVDERDEISLARKLEVERPIVLGRSNMASSVSRAIVPYQITHIYPMFFLTA
jgi:hypothetical protein